MLHSPCNEDRADNHPVFLLLQLKIQAVAGNNSALIYSTDASTLYNGVYTAEVEGLRCTEIRLEVTQVHMAFSTGRSRPAVNGGRQDPLDREGWRMKAGHKGSGGGRTAPFTKLLSSVEVQRDILDDCNVHLVLPRCHIFSSRGHGHQVYISSTCLAYRRTATTWLPRC